MSVRYGFNITASDMRKMLEENDRQQNGVRSWKKLFGNAALGYNAQSDALKTDYSSVIADAYATNFKKQNAILGAGYNTGATNAFLADNRNDLLAAYDSYIANYQKSAGALTDAYNEEIGVYDQALDERAKNFASLYNKAYDYLAQELSGAYQDINDKRIDYLTDQGFGDMLDEQGVLKSWTDLSYTLFDEDTGELTDAGKDFYNRIFNGIPQEWKVDDEKAVNGTRSMKGFDEWLGDNDAELREWWVSQDAFNVGGTNKDTATKQIGIDKMGTPDLSLKTPMSDIDLSGMQTDDHASWAIRGLGTGRKSGKDLADTFVLRLNVNFKESGRPTGGVSYKVETVDNVDEELSQKLNVLATGGKNTSPSSENESWLGTGKIRSNTEGKSNKLVTYGDKMYIYTKNGWREVVSRDERISTKSIVDAFRKKTK